MDALGTVVTTKRRYSDADKLKALTALDLNGGELLKTSTSLGIPIATLSNWRDGIVSADVSKIRKENRDNLADICETAAYEFIAQARSTVDASKGTQAATGAAIFIDKMRLLRGESTANIAVSTITQNFNITLEQAKDLHAANPTKYPLPDRQTIIDSYEATCQKNGVQPDYDAIDLSVLDGDLPYKESESSL